jgi:phosphatidylglycerophosphate synthase
MAMARGMAPAKMAVPVSAGLVAAAVWLVGWSLMLHGVADWPLTALLSGYLAFALLGAIVGQQGGWWRAGTDLGPANLVTLLRAALVCLIAAPALVAAGAPSWSLTVLTVVALGLDAVDGWLARRLGMVSAFGARFDLEIDALLLMVLAVLCWQTGRVGLWVLGIGSMRYAFVLAGRVWPWLCRPLPERRRRKVICAAQGIALGLALLPPVGPALASTAAALALLALGLSFALDLAWLARLQAGSTATERRWAAQSPATSARSDRQRA